MTVRERLHELVDMLGDEDVAPALVLLESRVHDPLVRLLADAPADDEPWTAEDEAAVAEVRADRAEGLEPLSAEQARPELELDT
ncbi:MAG: hypothetical protein M3417_01330 [Actinomycetota bacterium]|nr:hypothetical protein [Actinomycetota bacterium]